MSSRIQLRTSNTQTNALPVVELMKNDKKNDEKLLKK
jgi:hypothetical protein